MDVLDAYQAQRESWTERLVHRGLNEHDAEDAVQHAMLRVVETDRWNVGLPGDALWGKVKLIAHDIQGRNQTRAAEPLGDHEHWDDLSMIDQSDWPDDERAAMAAWRDESSFAYVSRTCGWSLHRTRETLARAAERCLA